jgi:hypothetical protein
VGIASIIIDVCNIVTIFKELRSKKRS